MIQELEEKIGEQGTALEEREQELERTTKELEDLQKQKKNFESKILSYQQTNEKLSSRSKELE